MYQDFSDRTDPTRAVARIAAMRDEMAKQDLTGFIVGHGDEYLNEYLPASAERLYWLTGFSGSAGLAIVLTDKAAIFTDGRYTLQTAEQVDSNVFEQLHLTNDPPRKWLRKQLKAGDRIGYDARLLTVEDAKTYRALCEDIGAELVAAKTNPLDAAWSDRPKEPQGRIAPHPIEFAGASAAGKLAQLQQQLAEKGTDTLIVTQPDNIAWLFNIRGSDVSHTPIPLAYAIVPVQGKASIFVDRAKLDNEAVHYLADTATLCAPNDLADALSAIRDTNAAVQLDPATSSDFFRVALTGGSAKLRYEADPIVLTKAQKTAAEIDGAMKAHLRDGVAMTRFLSWLDRQPPDTIGEIDAAQQLERFRTETGRLVDISFDTISAAGPNAALPHYRVSKTSSRILRDNSIYLVDSGGQYRDGTTDVTRTVIIGRPSDEMRDRYTRVLKGHIAIAVARFPEGTSGAQIDSFARKSLWEAGLDYDHGTGHGVGSFLSVHEGPARISKVSHVPLKPGMILSNEPGYYKSGHYGIRIENLVVVRGPSTVKGGERKLLHFETLTLVPIDKRLIAPGLLTAQEIQWLDAYHGKVRDQISPLLDRDDQDWLEKATTPMM